MTYKTIPISKLVVNPNNDRHGQQDSEENAIEWLFKNKPSEMRGLARDIATQGGIFDAPLVKEVSGKYIVYDGNRRTTCLKLIHDPSASPHSFRDFFNALNKNVGLSLPKLIDCQIETDQNVIDKILERRHNGKLGGEGQIKWDTRAKANHANRIGGSTAYPIAEQVEQYLEKRGYPNAKDIPRSNLAKILDTKLRTSRAGIRLNQVGSLEFTKNEDIVYPLLVKIADDLISGKLSLKQLLLSADKNTYFDGLSEQGFDLGSTKQKPKKKKNRGKGKPPSRKPKSRRTLIPQDINYDIDWREGQIKTNELWSQLQYQLKFNYHSLSIAVVFRVFLEHITYKGVDKYRLTKKGKLHQDIVIVSRKLRDLDAYDQSQHDDIERKVGDEKSLSSIASLQRALHSKSDVPADSDLISLWNCLEPYILGLLKT